jgi:hypothetical protein
VTPAENVDRAPFAEVQGGAPNARSFVTGVVISPSAPDSPFEASASVLWGGTRLSGFRLMANVDRVFSVVWSERRTADEHAVGLAPRGVPWTECREAILEAYRHRAHAN